MKRTRAVTRGGKNVFADLGVPNAEELSLKANLVMMLSDRIAKLGLTQAAAAERMGIRQPDVLNIVRGRFEGFSLERLLRFASALGNDVEISV